MAHDLEREILSWRRERAGRAPTHRVESVRPAAQRLMMNGREVLVVRRGRPIPVTI